MRSKSCWDDSHTNAFQGRKIRVTFSQGKKEANSVHRKEQEIKDTLSGLDEKTVAEVSSKWFIPGFFGADEISRCLTRNKFGLPLAHKLEKY